ncbi:hypothetical protein SAMN05421881_10213 [Nitrosomonas halophila]|uniref:Uncharacterized protein n=1 Tax=Nitrosomonas halophila TaxID=44576 RepID=A0A1H3HN26_9PROT|nr:hypothetical protein SAMN05421881_10213 [Nitrosomonas halophila]
MSVFFRNSLACRPCGIAGVFSLNSLFAMDKAARTIATCYLCLDPSGTPATKNVETFYTFCGGWSGIRKAGSLSSCFYGYKTFLLGLAWIMLAY